MQNAEKASIQSLEHHSPSIDVGNVEEQPAIPSSSGNAIPQPAKRPTRQWAAWTREEEESFFTALRQVGKNFEKITCRVQSKNKDQVRHYYYRLVRRMNKLLGPGLSLDAKDSKDTNAAMLRWWSLLEKYSCKASKLHLKPRRFKIFVEALEHQLMKDRKKNVKKRAVQGENYSSSPAPTTTTNQNKLSGNDARAVKVVVLDSQNVQKAGQGRGSSTKRNSNIGVIRSSYKGESSHTKPTRNRRKSGAVSAAAMKRWEKAAMAGVSLVADAAEHLERTADQLNCTVQTDPGPSGQVHENSSNLCKGVATEENAQPTVKLKLQLFPIDESTRKALEVDKHNPHLELTLSSRKKISSILEHLDRKWGTSSVASGELMIFPFNIQRENLLRHQRWTRDSVVTAAEVYAMIGSPPVFRLRYGWISRTELQSGSSEIISVAPSGFNVQENRRKQVLKELSLLPTEEKDKLEKLVNQILSNHQTSEKQNNCLEESATAIFGEANKNIDVDLHNKVYEIHNLGLSALSKRNGAYDESKLRNMEKVADQRASKSPSLSTREWADNLAEVPVRGMLTEVSDVMDVDCVETPVFKSSHCLEQIPFTCDSFDAAIAAHISSQSKIGFTEPFPHSSSLWDAEETCDAFSFRNRIVSNNEAVNAATAAPSVADVSLFRTISAETNTKIQDSVENPRAGKNVLEDPMDEHPSETHETESSAKDYNSLTMKDVSMQDSMENPQAGKNVLEDPMDECASETHETESSAKDYNSLTDIYWPESLGPLELDVPSCKYYSEDIILSDSMSGLNRLLASSLDAFQNCPLFGLDEKGPPLAATGAQGGASFAGKIGTSDKAGIQSLEV